MKTCFVTIIALLILSSCSKEDEKSLNLDSFKREKYFNDEVLTGDSHNLYGLWKAYNVFGGWSGYSKPDFDYLEIKPYGIYGIIRNDTLLEYGKISQDTFDAQPYFDGFQVKVEPDYMLGPYSRFGGDQYFNLVKNDTLAIGWGMVDGITISFSRIK
jgi:hypothetical protein